MGITDLGTYLLGTVALVLLPGPNSLFTLATATRRGVRSGYQAVAGVIIGDAVLMVASAAGLASLLRAYPSVFIVLKYAGAVYLVWLGLAMARKAWRRRPARRGRHARTVVAVETQEERSPFRRALVISVLNPKAILFFISFFIQFVDPAAGNPALAFLLLGLIWQVCSVLYLTMLIFGGSALAARVPRNRRLARAGTTAVGAVFVGFGVKLATTSLG